MTKKQRQKLIDELLEAGEQCANCCFNIGQEGYGNEVSINSKASMRLAQKAWDAARSAYHQAVTRDGE